MSTPAVRLVLASASPARLSTLQHAGVEAAVVVSDVDEDMVVAAAIDRYGPLEPAHMALLLARAKAEAVAYGEGFGHVVLGCDSVLELDGQVHGKPEDAREAVLRWRGDAGTQRPAAHRPLARRRASVKEGGSSATLDATASTTVYFADLSDEEIDAYVAPASPCGWPAPSPSTAWAGPSSAPSRATTTTS